MAALAGIGRMPDTIEDRAVIIKMRRRAPNETVQPYRLRRDAPPLNQLRAQLHRWARSHHAELTRAVPEMPLEDRAADTWEALIAIADQAGEPWPQLSRAAAVVLTDQGDNDESIATQLLADCRVAFARPDHDPHRRAPLDAQGRPRSAMGHLRTERAHAPEPGQDPQGVRHHQPQPPPGRHAEQGVPRPRSSSMPGAATYRQSRRPLHVEIVRLPETSVPSVPAVPPQVSPLWTTDAKPEVGRMHRRDVAPFHHRPWSPQTRQLVATHPSQPVVPVPLRQCSERGNHHVGRMGRQTRQAHRIEHQTSKKNDTISRGGRT